MSNLDLDLLPNQLVPSTRVAQLLAECGYQTPGGRTVSDRTVRDWMRSGRLRSTRSRPRHTTRAWLEEFLAAEGWAPAVEERAAPEPKRPRRQTARRMERSDAAARAECEALGI